MSELRKKLGVDYLRRAKQQQTGPRPIDHVFRPSRSEVKGAMLTTLMDHGATQPATSMRLDELRRRIVEEYFQVEPTAENEAAVGNQMVTLIGGPPFDLTDYPKIWVRV